jgi:hypothetical protein
MARYSLENPLQIMPEHAGWFGVGLGASVSKACDAFWVSRGKRSYSMRDAVHRAMERGKARKARRSKKA